MPYTVAEIITIAQISQYLAANDIQKSGLFGGGTDLRLPRKLYLIRKNVEWMYDLDPNDDTLLSTSNYLYALCGKYAFAARRTINQGGTVAPISQQDYFPIYITEADFNSATFYPNTRLFGKNIIVYLNEINRYLIPDSEFTVSQTGLTITLAGFDATAYTYNLVIEKYVTS